MTRQFVTFLGIPTQQIAKDFFLWEQFFNAHKIKCLFEIGTGSGGFSLYLAMQCYQRGAKFYTLDITSNGWLANLSGGVAEKLPMYMRVGDEKAIGLAIGRVLAQEERNHPLVVFCDGGDKPYEFNTYGGMLQPGDFIAVHDYNSEMYEKYIKISVEPIMQMECELGGSMTRWYKVAK